VQSLDHPQAGKIDFCTICNEGDSRVIGLSYPYGQPEVASFVVKCLVAGQKLMRQLKSDEPFAPNRGQADAQGVIQTTVFREATAETMMAMLDELQVPYSVQHVRNRMAILRHKPSN
jgi:hypothetical protein